MRKGANNTKQSRARKKDLLLLPKLFLVITVVLIMWIVVLLSGPLFGIFEPGWTGLSPALWSLIVSILIGIFIIIDIVLYATPRFFMGHLTDAPSFQSIEFPEIEQRDGKQIYEFTYPVSAKGGVFSKTYVQIGENAVLRIRNQMIKKEEIWKN